MTEKILCKSAAQKLVPNHEGTIEIPQDITIIGKDAFKNREDIYNVIFHEGLTEIQENAFMKCCHLKALTIPSTVREIGKDAFLHCSYLEEVSLLSEDLEIQRNAFTRHDDIKNVGNYPFEKSVWSKNVYLKIEDCESVSCLMEALQNKAVLLEVRYDPFDHECEVNSYAYWEGESYFYWGLADKETILRIYRPVHTLADERGYTVYDRGDILHITSAKEWLEAFCNHEKYNLTIQDKEVSDNCDGGDEGLIKGMLDRENTELYISYDIGNFCGALELRFMEWWMMRHPGYHTDRFFKVINGFKITECGTISKSMHNHFPDGRYELPIEVKRLGCWDGSRFLAVSHKEVIIPNGVLEIIPGTFSREFELEKVYLPDSITHISENVFEACYHLKEIRLPSHLETIGTAAFDDCYDLGKIDLPDSVKEIGAKAFRDCYSLKSIKIPSGVEHIASATFRNCEQLEEVILPETLKSIGSDAFAGCGNLKKIDLPDSLEDIGVSAFEKCTALKSIKIPSGVEHIASATFRNCEQLEEVILPETLKSIGSDAFKECVDLKMINVPEKAKIDFTAFLNCRSEIVKFTPLFNEKAGKRIPKGVLEISDDSIPSQLQYVIISPGKRSLQCVNDALNQPGLQFIFHCGRNLELGREYAIIKEKRIFVCLEQDEIDREDDFPIAKDRYIRFIIKSKEDIETLVRDYNLEDIKPIMEYLSTIVI